MAEARFVGYGGLSIAAETYGRPEDPAVLMMPAGGQTQAVWTEAATALAAAGRYVVCMDLRGHGRSAWCPDGRYDLDAHVGDLRAVLFQLGSRPVVVAASLGGWIATTALGESGGDLATALVLVDSAPHIDQAGMARVSASMRRHAQKPLSTRDWDPLFLDGIDVKAIEPRLEAAAAAMSVPTLIVRGKESQLVSRVEFEALAQLVAGAETAEIEGAGHLVASDAAEALNAVLLDFLERRAPQAAPEYQAGSDPRTLRDALGCFGTGVTVVTTLDGEGRPVGLTANSFPSVSLDPPLLLVCLARNSSSLPAFVASDHFAVNVLHIGQQLISTRFARREEDRFATTAWEKWNSGSPIVENSLASFECEKHAMYEGGDHLILVGKVLRVRFEPRRDPLLYFRGRYRRLHFQ